MKNLLLLFGLLVLLMACQTSDPEQEKSAVETTLNDFYTAMEDFNYDGVRALCTTDFSLYETGFDHQDMDGFIESVKSMEGAAFNVVIDIKSTEVSGNMAFSVVNFNADIAMGDAKMSIEAYETYVFKKVNNKWLLHYCHSTHLPDKSDNHLASLHLIKVPEGGSIDAILNAMDKFNQAIAEMGFWDCGYTVMQVVPNSNDEYNYFIKGNWKNQQTYDAIHNNEGWKTISENFPEEASSIMQNQIYLKVEDL